MTFVNQKTEEKVSDCRPTVAARRDQLFLSTFGFWHGEAPADFSGEVLFDLYMPRNGLNSARRWV